MPMARHTMLNRRDTAGRILIGNGTADDFPDGAGTEQHAERECGVGRADSVSGEIERQVLLDSSQRVRGEKQA